MEVTIEINGVEMQVQGSFEQGLNYGVQGSPTWNEFDVDFVYYKGEDISELLEAFNVDWNDIADKALAAAEEKELNWFR